jgi:hypothetical protein
MEVDGHVDVEPYHHVPVGDEQDGEGAGREGSEVKKVKEVKEGRREVKEGDERELKYITCQLVIPSPPFFWF